MSSPASAASALVRRTRNRRIGAAALALGVSSFVFPWWYVQYRKKQREESYSQPLKSAPKGRQAALHRGAAVNDTELRQMLIDDPTLFRTMNAQMVNRGLVKDVAAVHYKRNTWHEAGLPPPPDAAALNGPAPLLASAAGAAAPAATAGPTLLNPVSSWNSGYTTPASTTVGSTAATSSVSTAAAADTA